MSKDDGDMPVKKAGSPRWVKSLLVVSLGLNLLVVGVVAGAFFKHRKYPELDRHAPETRMILDLGLGPFMNAFAPDQRRDLGRTLRRELGNPDMSRTELAGELTTLLDVLRATPFDLSAFEKVIDRQRVRLNARSTAGRAVLLEAVAAMPDAERARFADRLERSLRRAVNNVRRGG